MGELAMLRIRRNHCLYLGLILSGLCLSLGVGMNAFATAQPSVAQQQPKSWEGACARCGEAYQWFGAARPIQRKCNKFNCNGAIIWQPVY